MKKIVIILILSFLLIGCSNNREKEINEEVLNSSYTEIINKIDLAIGNISYFPNEEYENEFIYYIKAMINNIEKFNSDEKDNIYRKLNSVNYTFKYNSLKYTNNDYASDISFFK